MTQPSYPPPYGQQYPPAAPRQARRWPWIVGGMTLLLLIGLAISPREPTVPTMTVGRPAGTAPSGNAHTESGCPLNCPPAPEQIATVPEPARAITAREWQLIAKDPGAHRGESVIVHGEVTQFDAATGAGGFRANVDGVVHKPRYGFVDYDTNTVLAGSQSQLAEVVQGDLFTAEVVVGEPLTYETTMGGQLPAPSLTITSIRVTGHLD
jgi:hypothetical protein